MLTLGPTQIAADRIGRAARAARGWNATADLPDPLDFGDFASHPEEASRVITDRRKSCDLIGSASCFPYPKPSGGMRQLADLDAHSVMDFRLRAGPVVAALMQGHASGELEHIIYGHFEPRYDTWQASPHKDCHRVLRRLSKQMAEDPALHGRLKLDVAEYYPTIAPELVSAHLATAGVGDAAAASIAEFLFAFDGNSHTPSGLPIGPEASLAIATAFLLPIDRALLRDRPIRLARWMDDYLIGCIERGVEVEAAERFDYQLALQRQRPNLTKSEYAPQGEQFSDAVSLADVPRAEMVDAAEFLSEQLSLESYQQVPFLLGVVRSNGDEQIVDVVQQHPELLRRFPRKTAEALGVMAKGSGAVQELLAELAVAPQLSDPARLHVVRTLRRASAGNIGGRTGKALFEQGCAHLERRAAHPVAAECFAAASRSDEKPRRTRERSIEVAMDDAPSSNVRRSLVGTLAPGPLSATHRSAVQEIGRKWPEAGSAAAMAVKE